LRINDFEMAIATQLHWKIDQFYIRPDQRIELIHQPTISTDKILIQLTNTQALMK
jgi:hypothetical protein